MKRVWNKKIVSLAAAAIVLTAGVTVDEAMAFFTNHITASGSKELHLGFTTTLPEDAVSDWANHITVKNEGANACYVRVKAFAGEQYGLSHDTAGSDGGWSTLGNDGYYYWHDILEKGASTGSLALKIDHANATDDFNVVIVQERTPVVYDENGVPVTWDKMDWTRTADVVKKIETQESMNGGED